MRPLSAALPLFLAALTSADALAFESAASKCMWADRLARQVMSARQAGVSMRELLVHSVDAKTEFDRMFKGIVVDAYNMPRLEGKQRRQDAANNFADAHYAACLEANKDELENRNSPIQ